MKHTIEICGAPICADAEDKEFLVWHPDEPICQKLPKENWQKKQESLIFLIKTGREVDKGDGWRIGDLIEL